MNSPTKCVNTVVLNTVRLTHEFVLSFHLKARVDVEIQIRANMKYESGKYESCTIFKIVFTEPYPKMRFFATSKRFKEFHSLITCYFQNDSYSRDKI